METTSRETRIRLPDVLEPVVAVEKLFVYGIFLDECNREYYGMENPSYDTVPGYITIGGTIVKAVQSDIPRVALTGLLVDVPTRKLPAIDQLEVGYDRIKVMTTSGFVAFMYVEPGKFENYSSFRSNMYEC